MVMLRRTAKNMRPNVDSEKIERLMQALGREAILVQGAFTLQVVRVENFIERNEGKPQSGQP